jgi:hypothetical protein
VKVNGPISIVMADLVTSSTPVSPFVNSLLTDDSPLPEATFVNSRNNSNLKRSTSETSFMSSEHKESTKHLARNDMTVAMLDSAESSRGETVSVAEHAALIGRHFLWRLDGKLWPVLVCGDDIPPPVFISLRKGSGVIPAIQLGRRK